MAIEAFATYLADVPLRCLFGTVGAGPECRRSLMIVFVHPFDFGILSCDTNTNGGT